jgi:hypothetical protein
MTAQDIDLKQFSADDLRKLQEGIDGSTSALTVARVCIFVDPTEKISFNYHNILSLFQTG